MAYEADRVVVELLAKTEGFDAKVKQSASSFDTSMDKIASAASKAEGATGGMGKAAGKVAGDVSRYSQSMKRDFVDLGNVLTGPTSPFVVPVKQAPAVSGAFKVISAGAGVLGGLLGGVLVSGAIAAASALVELVLRGKDANDEIGELVEKLKEHAEKTRQSAAAQQIFDRSIEGSIAKVDELTKALVEQNRTLEDNINLNKAAAAAALGNVVTNIATVSGQLGAALADLKNARAELTLAESGALGGTPTEIAASVSTAQQRVQESEANVRALSGTLDALNGAANRAGRALQAVDFPLFERNAKEAVDPIAKINRQYDDMAKKARQAGTYTDALAKSIERMREADLKAARARTSSSSGQSGRQFSFDEAASFARGQGWQVNSGPRTFAQQKSLYDAWVAAGKPKDNPVAPPGSSAHEGAKGRWALDIQFAPGLTAGAIKKKFADEGVSVNVFNERGHFHVSGSRSEAAAAETAAQRQAQQALAEQNRFEETRSRLNDALLTAQAALVRGVEAQADFARQQIEADEARFSESIQNDVEEGKLTQAHADQLIAVNHSIAVEKLKAIELERSLRLLQEEDKDREQAAQFKLAELDFAAEMARSQEARREIQLEILDIVYREKQAHLESLRLQAEKNGDLAEANRIQKQINELPYERSRESQRVQRSTMGPLASFLDSIPSDAREANEALEGLAVNGIRSVVDGLAQAGTEWIKLGGTSGRIINQLISDLIRLVLYQQLIGPLLGALGGGARINPFGGTPAVPDWITNSQPLTGAASGYLGTIGGRGGTDQNVLSINGRPALKVSKGEQLAIIPSNGRAASAGAGAQGIVIVGIQANDYFDGRVLQVTGPVIAKTSTRAATTGAGLARDNLARKQLHTLG